MPRTIEHIVGCHEAATALRKAGKPTWNHKINISVFLRQDPTNETPEHVAKVANSIGKLLRACLPHYTFDYGHEDADYNFIEAVENMEQCNAESLADGDACEEFNSWLEVVYDWADVHRVWLGA